MPSFECHQHDYTGENEAARRINTHSHFNVTNLTLWLIGIQGSGKSTLANKLMNSSDAAVGIGRTTTGIHKYARKCENGCLTVVDTEGVNGTNGKELIKYLESQLQACQQPKPKHIHSTEDIIPHLAIALFVLPMNGRLDDSYDEIRQILKKLNIPTWVVLTKAFAKEEDQKAACHKARCHFGGIGVTPVLIEAMSGVEPHGSEELCKNIGEFVDYFLTRGKDLKTKLGKIKDLEGSARLMFSGKTGAGKSKLISTLFDVDIAKDGSIEPTTTGIIRYPTDQQIRNGWNGKMLLYDTKGFENLSFQQTAKEVREFINKQNSGKADEYIHGVFYCVQEALEAAELEFLGFLKQKKIPVSLYMTERFRFYQVVLVQTQSYDEISSIQYVEHNQTLLSTVPACRIVAERKEFMGGSACESFGLEELVAAMNDALPDARRRAFISAQLVNIDLKKKQAFACLMAHCGMQAVSAFLVPLPLIDTIPIYTSLVAGISGIFAWKWNAGAKAFKFALPSMFLSTIGNIWKLLMLDATNDAFKLIVPIIGLAITVLLNTVTLFIFGYLYINKWVAALKNATEGEKVTHVEPDGEMIMTVTRIITKMKDKLMETIRSGSIKNLTPSKILEMIMVELQGEQLGLNEEEFTSLREQMTGAVQNSETSAAAEIAVDGLD